jgi:hypothetical protein
MKTNVLKILLLTVLIPVSALAQQTAVRDSLLEHMTGKWVLQGTIEGKETTHDIDAQWVLGHEYIQIKEVSREKDVDGKPVYEAIVYISVNETTKQYSCLWLDNTGSGDLNAKAIGQATGNGNKLAFLFNINEKSIFHTTFTYNQSEDTWQWLMDDEENGKWQSFAKMKLTRK